VGATACITYIGYLFAVGCNVSSIDSVALEATAGLWEEFSRVAPFPADIKAVLDSSVSVLGGAEGCDHERSSLTFETALDWFDPSHEENGFGREVVGVFYFQG
jgi:hypothetical protein